MKTILPVTAVLLSITAFGQPTENRLQQLIDSIYNSNPESVGLLIHVEAPKQNISWSGAAGYCNLNPKSRLEPDQPFLIASNIKTYVSATILLLVEKELLSINQPIKNLISPKSKALFESDGYDLDAITVSHLLSHTSGIETFANMDFYIFMSNNPKYRWTRDEQLERAIEIGDPIAPAGDTHSYSDTNYLLLTEIIETLTDSPFYAAMRQLLNYELLGLNSTWFPTLEDKPSGTKELTHQYWSHYNWDSYNLDVSMDLYGGGGIACTAHDMAKFSYELFNQNVVQNPRVFEKIFTSIQTKDSVQTKYYMGIREIDVAGSTGYGHNGFWSTRAIYFPDFDTAIAVAIIDSDKRSLLDDIFEEVVTTIKAE